MTFVSNSENRAKPSLIDMQRLQAVLFPHWILWAFPSLLLGICWLVDFFNARVEVSKFGYELSLAQLPVVAVLMLWRYLRFHAFDWFSHRLWMVMVMLLWIIYIGSKINLYSHMLMASGLPLVDNTLLAADKILGFNWNAYARFLVENPWRNIVLSAIYGRFSFIALFLTLLIALLRNDRLRMLEFCFLMVATAVACSTIAGLFPSYPTFYSVAEPALSNSMKAQGVYYLGQVNELLTDLREAPAVVIDPGYLLGVVTFPSFHSCLALIIVRCNRGFWPLNTLAMLLGLATVIATPVYGGHYLVDIICGAAITWFFVWLWTAKISKHVAASMPSTDAGAFQPPTWLKRLIFMTK